MSGFTWIKRPDLTVMRPPLRGRVQLLVDENGLFFVLKDTGELIPLGEGTSITYNSYYEVDAPTDVPVPPPGQVTQYVYNNVTYQLDSDGNSTPIGGGGILPVVDGSIPPTFIQTPDGGLVFTEIL